MDATQTLSIAVSLVIFSVVCVAIWNVNYQDTLTQRLGLVLVALGCLFVVYAVGTDRPLTNPMLWTLSGVAVFAVGTLIKRVRAHRLGKVAL